MADRRLVWALATVIARHLATIQPQARRELARWRRHAQAIPSRDLRTHVLRPFDADRSAEGAALFAVLAPSRRQRHLVPLLIAYVLLWSYVDVRSERDPDADPLLYEALVNALSIGADIDGFDDPYLAHLLQTCRRGVAALPSWPAVQPAALLLASDGRLAQQINHQRPRSITWTRPSSTAGSESPDLPIDQMAASSPLAIHALMALSAHPHTTVHEIQRTCNAYRFVSALGVLYDHFIDQAEDQQLSNYSYVLHQPTTRYAMPHLAASACHELQRLRDAERHLTVFAAMTAMFLSCDQAWSGPNATISRTTLQIVGPASTVLLTALRVRTRVSAFGTRSWYPASDSRRPKPP